MINWKVIANADKCNKRYSIDLQMLTPANIEQIVGTAAVSFQHLTIKQRLEIQTPPIAIRTTSYITIDN